MADDERRMLFDLRGRRKNVVRVVYAVLALLMGASLFFVVGGFNIGELVGTGGAGSTSEVLEEQAERIEQRLAKDPTNEALLLSLTRSRIGAGNAEAEFGEAGTPTLTPEAREQFELALLAWARYKKQAGADVNPAAAQLVASAFIQLAETGTDFAEVEEDVAGAAAAQRIAAEARPSLGSLSSLAIYEYYAGNFAAGDRAAERAAQQANSKSEAKGVRKQLAAYRKQGKEFAKQKRQAAKAQQGQAKETLENPLGGLGASP